LWVSEYGFTSRGEKGPRVTPFWRQRGRRLTVVSLDSDVSPSFGGPTERIFSRFLGLPLGKTLGEFFFPAPGSEIGLWQESGGAPRPLPPLLGPFLSKLDRAILDVLSPLPPPEHFRADR